jgi:ribonuclease HII
MYVTLYLYLRWCSTVMCDVHGCMQGDSLVYSIAAASIIAKVEAHISPVYVHAHMHVWL